MYLHGGLAPAKIGPGKQRKAQVDGGRIERVEALFEIDAEGIAGVKRTRDSDQVLGEIGVNAPVAPLVGVRQGGARHRVAEAHVVELGTERAQAGLDVAQAFAVGQLGEGHGEKLLPAREAANPAIPFVAKRATAKFSIRKMADQLRKDGAALVHAPLSAVAEAAAAAIGRSNRGKRISALTDSCVRACGRPVRP